MAYPTVSAPYGFKPVNLIGGQVFSGSTRNLPIAYGYNTNLFYGDFVALDLGLGHHQAVDQCVEHHADQTDPVGSGHVGFNLDRAVFADSALAHPHVPDS